MLITMTSTRQDTPGTFYLNGQTYDLPDDVAFQFVGAQVARFVTNESRVVQQGTQAKFLRITVRDRHFDAAGDGITTDTSAIQAAVDYASSTGGGVVELPAGTFKCNIMLRPGVILKGQGRGLNSVFTNGFPPAPNYTFYGGGTTLIPASTALPVISADGGPGMALYGKFSVSDLKISNTGGAIVSGSIGMYVALSRDWTVYNVEICNFDKGLQISDVGATAWSYHVDSCFIHDCDYGLYLPDNSQSATPGTISATDVRRCTVYGAYIRDMVGFVWTGGTIAANAIGLYVLGGACRAVSFKGIQFETNVTRAAVIGLTGQAPQNVTFQGCSFWEGRGTPHTGSVAVEYAAGVKLSLLNCSWKGFETCVQYNGGTDLQVISPHFTDCGAFGTVYNMDLGSFSYVVADSASLLGLSDSGLFAKSSDASTRTNNWHIRPSTQNSALYSGAAPSGTGTFTQWALYSKSDMANAGFLRLEVSDASYAAIGTSVTGTGTAVPLRVQVSGGQMGFFGSSGTTRPAITGSRGGNAALADLLTKLAALGLLTDSTT